MLTCAISFITVGREPRNSSPLTGQNREHYADWRLEDASGAPSFRCFGAASTGGRGYDRVPVPDLGRTDVYLFTYQRSRTSKLKSITCDSSQRTGGLAALTSIRSKKRRQRDREQPQALQRCFRRRRFGLPTWHGSASIVPISTSWEVGARVSIDRRSTLVSKP